MTIDLIKGFTEIDKDINQIKAFNEGKEIGRENLKSIFLSMLKSEMTKDQIIKSLEA